ncbi:hypothetical protein HMPREF9104_02038 [Lentilactobacillus kisonensis F0435]|uniref:Uncharacterized protein n=1 Tax=Lentilactobacillus kisonensis F0435 TaxID=797516 RepID=H1LHE7_9LACO|nr:hypothetical protein HMPREF9104_02038 [Lentilactobacillus kisonensis F0435]
MASVSLTISKSKDCFFIFRVRNQAVRDWSLSFLRQESRAWIFGGEGLGAKSRLGAARFCNVAKEQKFPRLEFFR